MFHHDNYEKKAILLYIDLFAYVMERITCQQMQHPSNFSSIVIIIIIVNQSMILHHLYPYHCFSPSLYFLPIIIIFVILGFIKS